MLHRSSLAALASCCVLFPAAAQEKASPIEEKVILDFEREADIKRCSNGASFLGVKAPPAEIESSPVHATSGKRSLKITFAGGEWPTVTTTPEFSDWARFTLLKADITVSRQCVVGFMIPQEKSVPRDGGTLYCRTLVLQSGRNEVVCPLVRKKVPGIETYPFDPGRGNVTAFELFMYRPHKGESLYIDNVRLSAEKWVPPDVKGEYREYSVAGTDIVLMGYPSASGYPREGAPVMDLARKLKGRWVPPTPQTEEQVEGEFRGLYEKLKREHPRAVMALYRDGEKGPDGKAYDGWRDAHINSHGPEAGYEARSVNHGKSNGNEIFMRHRSVVMKVDLSAIPQGSNILATKLMIVRVEAESNPRHDPEKMPNMWVVEPCNRPWEEYEVDAFQYAKDKFWKSSAGRYSYNDPDPDFLPIFLAYGPGQGKVTTWDFTEAVKFWTDGEHPNHGFMLHGDSHDFMMHAHTRESPDLKSRPAVLVIYEPKS